MASLHCLESFWRQTNIKISRDLGVPGVVNLYKINWQVHRTVERPSGYTVGCQRMSFKRTNSLWMSFHSSSTSPFPGHWSPSELQSSLIDHKMPIAKPSANDYQQVPIKRNISSSLFCNLHFLSGIVYLHVSIYGWHTESCKCCIMNTYVCHNVLYSNSNCILISNRNFPFRRKNDFPLSWKFCKLWCLNETHINLNCVVNSSCVLKISYQAM